MRRLFLLLFAVGFVYALQAQTTITSENAPDLGDQLPMYDIFDPELVEPGDAGQDVVWDFSGLIENGDEQVFGYIDPAGKPQVAEMNNPDMAEDINGQTNGYFYFGIGADADDGDFMRHGFWANDGGQEVWIAYDSPMKFYDYPITYNSSYTAQDFTGSGVMGSFATELGNTEYSFECDGEGMLILPHKVYPNALRVHIQETFAFMVDLGTGTLTAVATITDDSYYWFVEGVEGPVMTIIESTTDDFQGNSDVTESARWYRADVSAVETDFVANATTGSTDDVFEFTNLSTPLTDTDFTWSFDPATVEFVNGTDANSVHPDVRFTEAGTYSVTLTATNSNFDPATVEETKLGYITVEQAPELVAEINADVTDIASNDAVNFSPALSVTDGSSVSGTSTYQWAVSPGVNGSHYGYTGFTDPTSEQPQISFYQAGCYSIQLQVTNENYSNSPVTAQEINYISVDGGCVNAIDENADGVAVYPNPTTGIINIKADINAQISVTNALGQIVIETSGKESLDLSGFDKGVYFVKIKQNEKSYVKQVILK